MKEYIGQLKFKEKIDNGYVYQCLCGNCIILSDENINSGNIEHCGCRNHLDIDYTDKVIATWKVLGYTGNSKYMCKCTRCGNIKSITQAELNNKVRGLCGCKKNTKKAFKKGDILGDFELISKEDWSYTKWLCRCTKCGDEQIKDVYNMNKGVGVNCSECGKQTKIYGKHRKGEVFGDFELLEYIPEHHGYWLVKCRNCGDIREKHLQSLKKGTGDRCLKCKTDSRRKYKAGDVFGDYRLKELAYSQGSYWIAECIKCGDEQVKNTKNMQKGHGTICRECSPIEYEYKDLSKDMFGWLRPIRRLKNKNWECECLLCNGKKEVTAGNLVNGRTRSCGCLRNFNLDIHYQNDPFIGKEIGSWVIESRNRKLPTYNVRCKECGNRDTIYMDSIKRGYDKPCSTCYPQYGSKYEEEIAKLFPGAKMHDKGAIGEYEIDLLYEDIGIGIEFNGSYWHNDEVKNKAYHKKKSLLALDKGIRIIHIFDYEWFNEVSKNKICNLIKNVLYNDMERVYARDTQVTEVGADVAREFLNKYHIQGYAVSSVNIALVKDEEILGVMTFGSPRFSGECQYELIRLVFKDGISIVGGAEKMFKYFKDKYNAQSILSYCNIAKFSGEVYTRLGFKLIEYTEPNYVWYDMRRNIVLNRYKTTRKKLIEEYDIPDNLIIKKQQRTQ